MKEKNTEQNAAEIISFRCKECGNVCMTVSKNELMKYQRVWDLLQKKPLSDKQIEEFVTLCEQGFRFLGIFCANEKCAGESDAVISSICEWEDYMAQADVTYGFSGGI